MSYRAEAYFFYGFLIKEKKLFEILGFDPEKNNWGDVYQVLQAANLEVIQPGNLLIGSTLIGISVEFFQTEEGAIVIPEEKLGISKEKLMIISSFLEKYNLQVNPSWILAASYG